MVVFMPGETTSIALGEKGRLSRNFVVVAPALTYRALYNAPHVAVASAHTVF